MLKLNTKLNRVTQFVHLIILKRFNIYELYHKLFNYIESAERFQREPAHTLLIVWCDLNLL